MAGCTRSECEALLHRPLASAWDFAGAFSTSSRRLGLPSISGIYSVDERHCGPARCRRQREQQRLLRGVDLDDPPRRHPAIGKDLSSITSF